MIIIPLQSFESLIEMSMRISLPSIIKKYPINRINEERLIYCFIELLLADGNMISEELRNHLTEMEEAIVEGRAGDRFNAEILKIKKRILKHYNYYGQILDIAEVLEENE